MQHSNLKSQWSSLSLSINSMKRVLPDAGRISKELLYFIQKSLEISERKSVTMPTGIEKTALRATSNKCHKVFYKVFYKTPELS